MFKILLRGFYSPESSAQDHAVLVLLLDLVGFFISTSPSWSSGNVLYHSCTSFEGASRGGQPSNIFTRCIGAGRYIHVYIYMYIYIYMHAYVYTYICI